MDKFIKKMVEISTEDNERLETQGTRRVVPKPPLGKIRNLDVEQGLDDLRRLSDDIEATRKDIFIDHPMLTRREIEPDAELAHWCYVIREAIRLISEGARRGV